MSANLLEKWQKSKQRPPEHMDRASDRWIFEYKHERLGKEAAEIEAIERRIPRERINAVLWYPIAGFERGGEPCECKATVWLNGVCLGCGAKKAGTVEDMGSGVSFIHD